MARTITTTTTSTVVGFTFAVRSRGGNVVRDKQSGQVVPGQTQLAVSIEVHHLDPDGKRVPLPRQTPQTVKSQHRVGMPTPVRPVDQSLAEVLAKTYTGTPSQVLAAMATDYEALEYPITPAPAKG